MRFEKYGTGPRLSQFVTFMKGTSPMKKALYCCVMLILVAPSTVTAQQPIAQSPATANGADHMDQMAATVTRMAELCERMMQNEMAAKPYLFIAIAVGGVLLAIASVLFIVLEVQWITYWGHLLKSQKPP